MDIRELRSFCNVARLRSVSKAAKHLSLGQPTVTTHLKKLEDELSVVLFDRVKRPIRITSAGATLYQLAQPLVEGMDSLETEMRGVGEGGVIVVAATPVISHPLLRVVSTFRSTYPEVQILVKSRSLQQVVELVASGDVDLGLAPGPERHPELNFEGVFIYDRVLLTPLGHPLLDIPLISFKDIAAWPLLLMGLPNRTRALLEADFQRSGLRYQVIAELDSMDTIKRNVANGMGISIGPRVAVDPGDEKNLGIVSLVNLLPVEQAGVVTLKGKHQSSPVKGFIATLKERLRKEISG